MVKVLFAKFSPGSGDELWVTDGTPAGTSLLLDINPGATGSNPSSFTAFGNRVLFSANDGTHGTGLWGSDGTAGGTYALSNSLKYPTLIGSAGGEEFISAGGDLWVSNGTPAGTTLLANVEVGPAVTEGDKLFFEGGDSLYGGLWVSDGTSLLSIQNSLGNLFQLSTVSALQDFAAQFHSSYRYRQLSTAQIALDTAGYTLVVQGSGMSISGASLLTGGTNFKLAALSGTVSAATLYAGGSFADGAVTGGTVVGSATFSPTQMTVSSGNLEIIVDGTNLPVAPGDVQAIANGDYSGSAIGVSSVELLNGGSEVASIQLTASSLTMAAGDYQIAMSGSFPTSVSASLINALVAGGSTSLLGVSLASAQLTRISTGEVLLDAPDLGGKGLPQQIDLLNIANSLNSLFDSSAGGTFHLADGFSGSLAVLGDKVLFAGYDTVHGAELWSSDGTTPGTSLVADLGAGAAGSYPQDLTSLGTRVLFAANSGSGTELWVTDGTSPGTAVLADTAPFYGPGGFPLVNGKALFFASDSVHGTELWASNGTSAGTVPLAALSGAYFQQVTAGILGSRAFFAANDGVHGTQLWATNGTAAGTSLFADLRPGGSSDPNSFHVMDNELFFEARNAVGSEALWVTDGISAPVQLTTGVYGAIAAVACFAEGTRIATGGGDIAVERLRLGDRVRTVLQRGSHAIIWIGHREVDCTRHPRPEQVWPVRVSAGAFGPRRPKRDLWLSPDHAVFVADVLIPIKHLINGTTVVQVQVGRVRYHHVELARHDVLIAEGLPAESYLATDNRTNFADSRTVALHPDFAALSWEAAGCAPLVVAGPKLLAARSLLAMNVPAARMPRASSGIGRAA